MSKQKERSNQEILNEIIEKLNIEESSFGRILIEEALDEVYAKGYNEAVRDIEEGR